MDMELSSIYVHQPVTVQLVTAFCVLWPFIALALLRRKVRSPAPVAATLAPLALSTMSLWTGIINTARGMAVSGSGGLAAVAAGFAESLSAVLLGGMSAAAVAFFALVCRHRPVADGVTAAILAVTVANVAAAIVAAHYVLRLTYGFAITCVLVGLVAGIIAIAWCVRHRRGDRAVRAIPFALPVFIAVVAVMMVVVWQQGQQYIAIAVRGG